MLRTIAILLLSILKLNYKNANYYFKHIYYFSEWMLKYLKLEITYHIIHLYEFQSHAICVQNLKIKFTAILRLQHTDNTQYRSSTIEEEFSIYYPKVFAQDFK
jgi:hypothetical protein